MAKFQGMLLVTGETATASSGMASAASAAESARCFEAELRRCVTRQSAFSEPKVAVTWMPEYSLTVGGICNLTSCQPPTAATCSID